MSVYIYRRYELSDCFAINKLFFNEYGHDYPYPLTEFRRDLTEYSTIVLKQSVGLIGFARATPYCMGGVKPHTDIFEFGGLIVHPEHRHRKIARRLTEMRMEAVLENNARIICSEPVCNRPFCESQYNLLDHGFEFCGIRPFKYPSLKLSILGEQAESVISCVRYVKNEPKIIRPVFVPQDYLPFLRAIPYFAEAATDLLPITDPMPEAVWDHAITASGRKGSDFVHVPINWPAAIAEIISLRKRGFLFSGFLPAIGRTASGRVYDFLTLYRAPAHSYNFSLVHVIPQLQTLKMLMIHEYTAVLCNQPAACTESP